MMPSRQFVKKNAGRAASESFEPAFLHSCWLATNRSPAFSFSPPSRALSASAIYSSLSDLAGSYDASTKALF